MWEILYKSYKYPKYQYTVLNKSNVIKSLLNDPLLEA